MILGLRMAIPDKEFGMGVGLGFSKQRLSVQIKKILKRNREMKGCKGTGRFDLL